MSSKLRIPYSYGFLASALVATETTSAGSLLLINLVNEQISVREGSVMILYKKILILCQISWSYFKCNKSSATA